MSALPVEIPLLGTGRLALLGTGTVGSAFVQRYQALQARGLEFAQRAVAGQFAHGAGDRP